VEVIKKVLPTKDTGGAGEKNAYVGETGSALEHMNFCEKKRPCGDERPGCKKNVEKKNRVDTRLQNEANAELPVQKARRDKL